MRIPVVDEIISVLNNDIPINDKHIELMEMKKRRRGNNRILVDIVCEMTAPLVLPLSHDEPLMIHERKFTENERHQLKCIILASKCTYFNAVCGEALWMQKHDIDIARKAVVSYSQELDCPSVDDELIYTELTVGICRLYSKCSLAEFDFESFLAKSLEYVKHNYDSGDYRILFILNGLLDCTKNTKQIERCFEDAIFYYEFQKMFDKAIGFTEELEKFYTKSKRTHAAKNLRVRIAENQEKLADQYDWGCPEHAHRIIFHIHSAMNTWETVNDERSKVERQRLAKRIGPVKRLSLLAFKELPIGSVDISEWIKKAEDFVKNATFESLISQVAMAIPLKSYETAKSELRESPVFFGMGLFPVAIQDGNGRKKRVIPPLFNASKEDVLAVVEHKTAQEYAQNTSMYIENLLKLASPRFNFTEENLEFLVKDNLLIPPEHSVSFLKGIVAGFNMDLISAMHLLMPQVEHCIRCLAEECGAVAYKTDRKGIEDCLSLKSILNLPELVECLDETFIFNLRVFFVSKYGFDMRNEVCHGLRSDSELQSADCLATWWFILRICCTYSNELNRRLS